MKDTARRHWVPDLVAIGDGFAVELIDELDTARIITLLLPAGEFVRLLSTSKSLVAALRRSLAVHLDGSIDPTNSASPERRSEPVKKIDGGPAFPRPGHFPPPPSLGPKELASRDRCMNEPDQGMSLRDWFAGQALAALIGNRTWVTGKLETATAVAEAAYLAADMMIEVLNRPPASK